MAISETAHKNHDELGAALTAGVTPVEVGEIVYQAVPYAGMGKVFDFLHATNDVLTERGVRLPLHPQATTTPATRAEEGRAMQEQIVGAERVAGMHTSAAADELHFQRSLAAINEVAPAAKGGE